MALVVGLDIGTKTIAGAVFSGSAKRYRLVDFFVEEVPGLMTDAASGGGSDRTDGDGEEAVSGALTLPEVIDKLVRERNLKFADFICAVDTKECVLREFVVPFVRDEQIRKTVFFEAEGHFTGLDLDDAILEYVKVAELEGKSRLLAWALRSEAIEERLALLKEAGVDPVVLDLDVAALFNAFAVTPTFDPERTTLLVDMGRTSTKLILIEAGRLKKVRALRLHAAVASPERMIPEPAAVGGGGGAPAGDGGDGSAPGSPESSEFESFSIDARFQEIEEALRRLDPALGEGSGGNSGGDDGATPALSGEDPIAVLSDDDFDRLSSRGGESAGGVDTGPAAEDGGGAPDAPGDGASGYEGPGGNAYAGRFPGQARHLGEFDYDEYLERVGIEVQRSLAAAQLASPVELICLTGGMGAREDARRYFSEQFDVETIQLDFGEGESFASDISRDEDSKLGTLGAVAVGLALKGLGHDRVGLDFRKGRFRYEHRFERLKFPLVVTASLVFLLCLQATFWAFRSWKEENLRAAAFEQNSRQVYEAFFEKKLPEGADPLAETYRVKRTWANKGQGGQSYRYVDVAACIEDVGNVLKASGMHFTISSMKFYFQARLAPTGRGKTLVPRAPSDSSIELVAEDGDAPFTFKKVFNDDPKSRFFTVEAKSPRSGQEGYQVTLDLSFRPERLQELFRQ